MESSTDEALTASRLLFLDMQQLEGHMQRSQSTSRRARKNVTRACEQCRRRRTKCNGARPQCSRCLDHATDCTYGAEEDGRKPASKSYVEALRGRINLLEQILQLHSIDIKAGIATLNERAGLNDLDSANSLAEDSEFNSAAQMQELQMAFEGTLSLEDSVNFEQDGEAHYFGPTSSRLEFRETDHNMPQDRLLGRDDYDSPAKMSSAATSSDSRAELYARIRAADTKHGIAEELKIHLIDLFFVWQNPWLQVVDEALFRESRSSNGRYCSLLLEYCILAFGSRFTDNREVRSDPEDPSTAGKAFYEKAQLILQFDLKFPAITTIQSLTLLSSLHVAFGSDSSCWLSQGMAYRMAIDMGLNIDVACLAGSNSLPPQEIELRRNIYWALFCDDKLAAAYTGRVCALPEYHGLVNLPTVPPCTIENSIGENNHDPWAVLNNQSLRIRYSALVSRGLISLSQIIDKILLSLYAPKPQCRGSQIPVFFESCSLELRNWLYDLPVEIRCDRPNSSATLPHAYTLLMVYHTTCILLAMPFLNKRSIFPHDNSGDNDDHQQTRQPNIVNQATAKLGNSARQICSIARRYQQVYGSFRLSAITATHCTLTAAVALLRIYPDGSKHDANSQLQDDLAVCLEVLDELSVSWNVAFKLRRNLVQLISRWRSNHNRRRSDEMAQCPSDNVASDLGNTTGTSQSVPAILGLEANSDHMPLFPGQLLPPLSLNMDNLDLVPDVDWDELDLDGFLGTMPQ